MARLRRSKVAQSDFFPGFDEIVEIGIGSLATVYRAREQGTNRLVALKLLNVRDASPRAIESFERESIALGAVSSHPNIVTLFRSFRAGDGRPVLVLELCRGAVSDRMRDGQGLPVPEVVALGIKIAGALETAHRAEILHRDVKPQNVLITEFGEPALADFGVAMLQSSTQTTAGLFDFTTLHAAPELLEGGQTSAATDVYELASSLYQLIAGRSAFRAYDGESPASVILRILRDPVQPLLHAHIPAALSDLLIYAMSKDKDSRPPTAAEFAAELATIEVEQGWPRTQFLIRDPGAPRGVVGLPTVTRMPMLRPRNAPPVGLAPLPEPAVPAAPEAPMAAKAPMPLEAPSYPEHAAPAPPTPEPPPSVEAPWPAQPAPAPVVAPEPGATPAAADPGPIVALPDWSEVSFTTTRHDVPAEPGDGPAAPPEPLASAPDVEPAVDAEPEPEPVESAPAVEAVAEPQPAPAESPPAPPATVIESVPEITWAWTSLPAPPTEPDATPEPDPASDDTPAETPVPVDTTRRLPLRIDEDADTAFAPPSSWSTPPSWTDPPEPVAYPTGPPPSPPAAQETTVRPQPPGLAPGPNDDLHLTTVRPRRPDPVSGQWDYPIPPSGGTGGADPAVPTWSSRGPAPSGPGAASTAPPSDLRLDPASLRRKVTIRSGAASLVVDDTRLRLRVWFSRSAIPWSDVIGFEQRSDDAGGEARGGRLVALTHHGAVELPATRSSASELRYWHALLEAYRQRAGMTGWA